MSEHQSKTLGDYFTLQRGTTYEGKLLGLPGPVLLGLGTIKRNGGFRSDSLRTYGGKSPEKLLVYPSELYVSLKDVTQSADLLGAVARLPKNHSAGRLTQDTVKLETTGADVPVDYLYWVMRTPEYRSYCRGRATGTTNLGLSREDFLSFEIPAPTEERLLMVRALDSLDDKIELNRRMNATLEAMARAIFKSWFVDFDPVHAKASGEPEESICQRLGLTPEVLALFPDCFEDSDAGEIPQGWRSSSLVAEAKRHGGFVQTGPFGSQLHAADYVPEGVPVVMPQDLVNRRISVAQVARVTDEMAERLSRHAMKVGDVVYSRRGDVERHALVSEREAGWLCGTGCLLVRLGDTWPSQAYLSEVLDLPATREWLVRHAVGATMPNLNTSILGAVPLLLPPDALLHAFERIAGPLRTQQIAASIESDSLLLVRDALLPRLLSGKFGVSGENHSEELMHV